ncbi:hypothetical protein [Aliiglaciecola litoralis]|uniref:hypothetical protein n=1 Tax=Aliiglaciecola litoralis TaxID=582857 RepID=UPI0031D88E77
MLIKSHKQTPLTIGLVFTALFIGCAGLTSVLVINEAAKQSYAKIEQPLITNVGHVIVANPGQQLNQSDYSTLRTQGFTNIIAVAEQRLSLDNGTDLVFLGIDYFAILNLVSRLGSDIALGLSDALSKHQARYLIHPQYAKQLTTQIYQRDSLSIQVGETQYGPVQEFDGAGIGNQLIADIAQLYEDFPTVSLSYLMVVDTQNTLIPLKNSLPSHLSLKPIMTATDAKELTASFHLNLLAMGLLMFVVCLFVIMNA